MPNRVCIVVLGDIGRSPRMQNHALSLAENGLDVDLVGYRGSKPPESLLSSNRINLHYLQEPWRPPPGSSKLLFLLNAPFKILYQTLQLFWLLSIILPSPQFLLVQNPPAIPTLFIVQLICWLRSVRLIIDWHNFGYTILALNLGFQHPVVRLAAYYERLFGRHAYAHLCVTKAMATELKENWHVVGKVIVLHDRSPEHFRRLNPKEAHQFWGDLTAWSPEFRLASARLGGHTLPHRTLFTELNQDQVRYRPQRPRVIVSSTSWTADEDFSVLLLAAKKYDLDAETQDPSSRSAALPPLILIITGKGPQKAYYETEIQRLQLRHVHILTLWLAAEDYPRLLGLADLGVCLHQSSSGLDLPMKVVDMFGCGLPVCAVKFQCIGELVQHNRNGWVFETSDELVRQWKPNDLLDIARENVRSFQSIRWSAHWRQQARKLFF
ncbi:hypothetical protein BJ085DRAFT_43369 [Dimargaris cristalligena]|uniref:Chitobiosyldiphosphodolichol beta-mannosyltransferase n=1 Tax=Dimargaris cristalligena TaxID=215637 RepID=A0A4P9ZN57_9FUNG|nr:hypothetical protein BJ085DRAFT_43369 [Dimargaris cristalligena]|eukprot:RKP34834.1 hypothetical protein BJ085DRAFT_43369 [Dimargaris cristalligena]